MSSNWTVVVFTQMVTGRSLSLSLVVVVVVVVVGDIYIPQSDRRYVCAVVCLRPSSLFVVVLDVVVVARLVVRCSSSLSSSSSKNWIGKNSLMRES